MQLAQDHEVDGPVSRGGALDALDREDQLVLLAPVGDLHERWAVVVDLDLQQVGERGAVPAELRTAAVEADEPQGDVGVRRAGGGIAVRVRSRGGVRGIRDPPGADRPLVHPGHEQGRAVGEPPVAAVALELLAGHELGEAPRDVVAVGLDQGARRAVVGADQVQPALGDVGDVAAVGGQPRVDHCAGCRELAGAAGDQVGEEQPRGQGEGSRAGFLVGGVRRDARATLAHPLTAGPLLRRQLLVGPVAQQRRRVDEEGLLAGLDVDRPQEAGAGGAGHRAHEDHAVAVRRDGAGPRDPEGEPLRPRHASRERVAARGVRLLGHGSYLGRYPRGHDCDRSARPPLRPRPPRRRVHQQRCVDGALRRGRSPGDARDLHARGGGRGARAGPRAPGGPPPGRPRRAPGDRAGHGHGDPGCHRPPLPRRSRVGTGTAG